MTWSSLQGRASKHLWCGRFCGGLVQRWKALAGNVHCAVSMLREANVDNYCSL
jgi:hypothetical protein